MSFSFTLYLMITEDCDKNMSSVGRIVGEPWHFDAGGHVEICGDMSYQQIWNGLRNKVE